VEVVEERFALGDVLGLPTPFRCSRVTGYYKASKRSQVYGTND
jgi:hypothetical protein